MKDTVNKIAFFMRLINRKTSNRFFAIWTFVIAHNCVVLKNPYILVPSRPSCFRTGNDFYAKPHSAPGLVQRVVINL